MVIWLDDLRCCTNTFANASGLKNSIVDCAADSAL